MSEQQPQPQPPAIPVVPPGFAATGEGTIIVALIAVIEALREDVAALRAEVDALTAP